MGRACGPPAPLPIAGRCACGGRSACGPPAPLPIGGRCACGGRSACGPAARLAIAGCCACGGRSVCGPAARLVIAGRCACGGRSVCGPAARLVIAGRCACDGRSACGPPARLVIAGRCACDGRSLRFVACAGARGPAALAPCAATTPCPENTAGFWVAAIGGRPPFTDARSELSPRAFCSCSRCPGVNPTWRSCCAASCTALGRAATPPLPPLKLTRLTVTLLTTVVL